MKEEKYSKDYNKYQRFVGRKGICVIHFVVRSGHGFSQKDFTVFVLSQSAAVDSQSPIKAS